MVSSTGLSGDASFSETLETSDSFCEAKIDKIIQKSTQTKSRLMTMSRKLFVLSAKRSSTGIAIGKLIDNTVR